MKPNWPKHRERLHKKCPWAKNCCNPRALAHFSFTVSTTNSPCEGLEITHVPVIHILGVHEDYESHYHLKKLRGHTNLHITCQPRHTHTHTLRGEITWCITSVVAASEACFNFHYSRKKACHIKWQHNGGKMERGEWQGNKSTDWITLNEETLSWVKGGGKLRGERKSISQFYIENTAVSDTKRKVQHKQYGNWSISIINHGHNVSSLKTLWFIVLDIT